LLIKENNMQKKRILNRFNLYERNIYKFFSKNTPFSLAKSEIRQWVALFITMVNKLFLHKIYLNYVELPITTKCSLRCKNCANLIQYYEYGEFLDGKSLINDVYRLCQITEKIEMFRILGGEPLLHPQLKEILEGIKKNDNIKNIQIVTNGTLLFQNDILEILKDKRVSVDISNYGKVSRNYEKLIRQLRHNRIKYTTNKNLVWTKQADFLFQDKSQKDLELILKNCKLDCISMLDGEVHICPRSSNGSDLKIFQADKKDYINLRLHKTKKEMRKSFFALLNRRSIVACNYCKSYMWDKLEQCMPGEQVSRDWALKKYHKTMRLNRRGNNEFGSMGGR